MMLSRPKYDYSSKTPKGHLKSFGSEAKAKLILAPGATFQRVSFSHHDITPNLLFDKVFVARKKLSRLEKFAN